LIIRRYTLVYSVWCAFEIEMMKLFEKARKKILAFAKSDVEARVVVGRKSTPSQQIIKEVC